jgi:cytosine/adenosine deaminase-related metal-dependent hydrolase
LSRPHIVDLVGRGWLLAYCPYSQLQFGVLGPLDAWLAAGGTVALGTDCVASNDALDIQRELPLVAGNAALATSFGGERSAQLQSGDLTNTRRLEAARIHAVRGASLIEPHQLLKLGDGRAFDAWIKEPRGANACSPLRVGALANFLILDQHHPALFSSENLARALCYGATSGAIKWGVVAGRPVGIEEGWQRAWLAEAKYTDLVAEAQQRKTELFARARVS